MQHARSKPLLRVVSLSALAVLLGVVSLTLTQCTMTSDNLTGVGLDSSAPTTCIKQCNDEAQALSRLETKKHMENIAACQELSGQAKSDCLAAEEARHSARKDEINDNKVACQESCHHQGVGSAG